MHAQRQNDIIPLPALGARSVKERYPNRITALREAKGWTQRELAQATVISESQISKIERGATMTLEAQYKIAKALECDPWELFPEWAERKPSDHIRSLWPAMSNAALDDLLTQLGLHRGNDCAKDVRGETTNTTADAAPVRIEHAPGSGMSGVLGIVATAGELSKIEIKDNTVTMFFRERKPPKSDQKDADE